MIRSSKLIIFLLNIFLVSNLSAMTQAVRKSPNVTRQALVAARTRVVRTPVRAQSTLSMPKNQISKPAYNQAFKSQQTNQKNQDKQSGNRNNWAITGGSIAAGIGLAALIQAREIADTALELYNMAMFDEELISDEFSNAIVKIYAKSIVGTFPDILSGRGSAFIVHSEKNHDHYFVITAAHCVSYSDMIIALNDQKKLGEQIYLIVEPIIVDNTYDVAVLFISPEEVKKYKKQTGKEIYAIWAKQLSEVKPYKKEVVALQGYPAFLPYHTLGFHREKCVSQGSWQNISSIERFSRAEDRDLSGASGSPVIAIRNKQPQIVGIHSRREKPTMTLSTGVGELPTYLEQAERIQQEKLASENWADYFKSFFWSK